VDRPLAKAGRTVWFDRSDARPDGNPGGDFATGNYKDSATPRRVHGPGLLARQERTP
jgi:hypothetical protein